MSSRRLVSVLFLDLVGWTQLAERLDPEPLQQLLERYYEICVAAVEEHGGVIEKFIGDAVMAVFGAERSQEDDAVRALHTAARIRERVTRLHASRDNPLDVHCGVAAGEALVTQSSRAGLRVVGDVVNLAARLQSAAPAGETYLNEVVMRLVRSQLDLAAVAPLTLKGKSEPVPTWRLVSGTPGTHPNAPGEPAIALVDREDETHLLQEAYRRVVDTKNLQVLTMLGLPGVGKSRLVRDLVRRLGADQDTPRTAYGACPSYGAKDSYAALGQMLETLLDRSGDGVGSYVGNPRVAAVLSHVQPLGTNGNGSGHAADNGGAEPGVEEISWAVRALLSSLATKPLVLLWDDLQWAAPALLDLMGELVETLHSCPVLMVCIARPELAENCPSWMLPPGAVLTVDPLPRTHTLALVEALAVSHAGSAEVVAHGEELLDRVATESAGNPLFAELMVETVASGQPLEEVPPSIAAMVGAMIDRLRTGARALLEAAAVVGPTFTLDYARQLYPALEPADLDDLTQRRLVRAGSEPGAYRFVQQVVHDVVYRRLGKNQRLSWHHQLAEDGIEPAFHLESAVRLTLDLNPDDPALPALAERAAGALLQEGTYALRRRDLPAAIAWLERAEDIASHGGGRCRAVAAVRLSDALLLANELPRALATVRQVAEQAREPSARLLSQVQDYLLTMRSGQACEVPLGELRARLDPPTPGDLAWCRYHQVQMLSQIAAGRFGAAEEAVHAALRHARGLPDAYEEDRMLVARCEIGQWSPTPIDVKLVACAELADRFGGDRYLLVPILVALARMRALTGDLTGAWEALAEARTAVAELRLNMGEVLVEQVTGFIHSLCGEPTSAERHYRAAVRLLDAAGHEPAALTMRVLATRERLGRDDGADMAAEVQALADQLDKMDLRGRVLCLATWARAMPAASGVDLVGIADRVKRMIDVTDDPCLRGDAYFDLARAHRRAGDEEKVTMLVEEALSSYATVGATYAIRRVRQWN